jgi:hypothetical protein
MKGNNVPKIYESPDKGKTVYARDFGSDPRTRVLIKSNEKETRLQNSRTGSNNV